MEYTNQEKQALTILGRTDFKNLAKTDVLSFVSLLGDMRPEVATQALAQFPEFASLVQASLGDYREMLDKVITSDDDSLHQVYGLSAQEMQSIDESRRQFYDLANRVHADLSKCLDKENLTDADRKEILSQEMEVLKTVAEKDADMRLQQREVVREAHQKDSEKRQFNWKLVGGMSAVVIGVIGVGASLLGGKIDFHLPPKS